RPRGGGPPPVAGSHGRTPGAVRHPPGPVMSASATPAAWADVRDIAAEWEASNPGGARDFFDRFEATPTILEQFPRLYGRVRRAPRPRDPVCPGPSNDVLGRVRGHWGP